MYFKIVTLFLTVFGGAIVYPANAFQDDVVSYDSTYVRKLLGQSQEDINYGRLSLALEKVNEADSLSQELNFEYGKILSTIQLGDILITQRRLDSAIVVLNEGVEKYPDTNLMMQFYNLLGAAFSFSDENLQAIEYYKKALEVIPNVSSRRYVDIEMSIRQNMATTYRDLGNMEEAYGNYLKVINYAEEAADTSLLVITLNNLGNAYNGEEMYDQSEFYLTKARNLAIDRNMKNDLYLTTVNLAISYTGQDNLQEALTLYEKALVLHKEIRPDVPPVIVLYNLGKMHGKMGNFEQSKSFFTESLEYSQQEGIPMGLYHNNYGLGDLYSNNQQFQEAIPYYEEALTIAKQLDNGPMAQDVLESLYISYREINRYKTSLDYLEEYKQMSDSLTNIERDQAIAELENELELGRQNEINKLLSEKQAQQEKKLQFQFILIVTAGLVIALVVVILFLMKKSAREKEEVNAQLREQKKKLEEADKAKDELFAMIAHDLRSPLGSMQGVLHLLKNKAISDEVLAELIPELEQSVQQNVNVMEDLLAWAKKQLSGVHINVESVNLKEVVEDATLGQRFMASRKGIDITLAISETGPVQADSNALKSVIRNLISNSIKYTPKEGNIKVETVAGEGTVQVLVKDSGIGIPDSMHDKIFESESWTREGTNREKGSGFGLNMSKELVEKMGGRIWFESTETQGTTFFVELIKK